MSLLDPRLEAFFRVAQNGTVHGAAKELNLSQTGVTQRLRSLERQLKTTLFIRSRMGMKMSHEGQALFRYCQNALELEGSVFNEVSGSRSHTTVRITVAGPTSIVSSRIIPSCTSLYKEFPNLALSYQLDDRENRIELLKKGLVQLAIVSPQEVALEMDSKRLKPDKYVLVASPNWKGRKVHEVVKNERIVDFYESDETTTNYLKKFDLISEAKSDRIFANTNFALISLLKAGVGYGTLTQEVAATSISRGELITLNQSQVLEDPQALAWYPRKEMPLYFSRLVACIK
jgi:LysR family transcriptional regulator, chromosome initiation inhibitor